jgi:hypothetical protein
MLSAISKYIVPSFLQRFDRYLLVNHPHLWRTRGHYVGFYSFLATLILFLAGYFYPQTLYDLTTSGREMPSFYISVFGIFLSIGMLFSWWYYIQKFEYKRLNFTHFLSEIGIYAICLTLLWSSVFAFLLGHEYRLSLIHI